MKTKKDKSDGAHRPFGLLIVLTKVPSQGVRELVKLQDTALDHTSSLQKGYPFISQG